MQSLVGRIADENGPTPAQKFGNFRRGNFLRILSGVEGLAAESD